jgi:ketosteroid isomerase-like protein
MTRIKRNITLGVISITAFFSFTTFAKEKTMTISNLLSQYEQALNNSDTAAVMKLYGESPIFMPQHAPAQVGRASVEAAYNNVFNNIRLNVKFTTHEVEELGDTAWVRTTSAGKTTIVANGAVIDEGNNELFIFRKEKGDWKIHRYLFATTTPKQ